MKIIGISPLDQDSTACLVEDGRIVMALAEERLSRTKLHRGFPWRAINTILAETATQAEEIDRVAYAFLLGKEESQCMQICLDQHRPREQKGFGGDIYHQMRQLPEPAEKEFHIPGLDEQALSMKKPWYKNLFYRLASQSEMVGTFLADQNFAAWTRNAAESHRHYTHELQEGLRSYGWEGKLNCVDHHMTHAANAYLTSGFDEALIVTLDGYGTGMAGSASVGRGGKMERLHALPYPHSLGEFYGRVTSALGFRPSRHEGKIVGLAAYDDPDILYEAVRSFFDVKGGNIIYKHSHNNFLCRYLASRYAKPTVAAAFQKVLERLAAEYVEHFQKKTGLKNLVLSGGVIANVKANQRMFEVPGIENIYVFPNMGDGGCGAGAALLSESQLDVKPYRISDVYWGPEYDKEAVQKSIDAFELEAREPENLEKEVARLLAQGNIVARFAGRMEYGPRALGNRSILYHAKDPSVNLWLNKQLKRTEFMPFAPATLYEQREECYHDIEGAEYPAHFMTVTFDCTDWMIETCPAAVHVDGTARPQLVSQESNPGFYRIIEEYYRLTGIPSIINTSFNMHEEPIVCTPEDALRAFTLGNLHYLAIGPFLLKHPHHVERGSETTRRQEALSG